MKAVFFVFSLTLLHFNLTLNIFPQPTDRKKPVLTDFGSSLKREPEENLKRQREHKKKDSNEDVIRIETNLVVLDFSVLDTKGSAIYGLKEEDFIITEDNQPQEVQIFSLGDDTKIPRTIVLIFDYSGSLSPYLKDSVEAAKLLVDKLSPNDLMAIVTDDVKVISPFTSDKNLLKKKLNSLKPGIFNMSTGQSEQYSSLYAVLNEMFDEEDIRPIVIFQTDGDQLPYLKEGYGRLIYRDLWGLTEFSFEDLMKTTEKSRASIYTIIPGVKLLGLSKEEKKQKIAEENRKYLKSIGINPDKRKYSKETLAEIKLIEEKINRFFPNGLPDHQEALQSISSISGGWIDFFENPIDADKLYSRIFSDINTRYIIGYSPTNEIKDGKRRTVKIEVKNHPEYTVWGRKTYIAPLPD